MGDGVPAAPLLRPRRARRGRRDCSSGTPATTTTRASSAPSTSRRPDWLSFFFFTYFTDRDGKFQLASLRESAFDPLSRTCDFMLKEEAHHMFVGASGVGRVVQRTRRADEGARHRRRSGPFGGIDVATLQRYLNFHYSVSLDLFGAETSTNAANYYAAGLKGRFQEERARRRPSPAGARRAPCRTSSTATIGDREAPSLAALNETLRDDYIADCQKGVDRWNRTLAEVGLELHAARTSASTGPSASSPPTT